MASPASIYATSTPKAPKARVSVKRAKRCKCLISVKAKKNYEAMKTGLRHFLASEPVIPGLASAFTLALNEATACEMEDSVEEAEKATRKAERAEDEAKRAAAEAPVPAA